MIPRTRPLILSGSLLHLHRNILLFMTPTLQLTIEPSKTQRRVVWLYLRLTAKMHPFQKKKKKRAFCYIPVGTKYPRCSSYENGFLYPTAWSPVALRLISPMTYFIYYSWLLGSHIVVKVPLAVRPNIFPIINRGLTLQLWSIGSVLLCWWSHGLEDVRDLRAYFNSHTLLSDVEVQLPIRIRNPSLSLITNGHSKTVYDATNQFAMPRWSMN